MTKLEVFDVANLERKLYVKEERAAARNEGEADLMAFRNSRWISEVSFRAWTNDVATELEVSLSMVKALEDLLTKNDEPEMVELAKENIKDVLKVIKNLREAGK